MEGLEDASSRWRGIVIPSRRQRANIRRAKKGKIVLLTRDGRYAYVHIASDGPGAHATLRPLDTLKKIGEAE
jgi:hypothetical protein